MTIYKIALRGRESQTMRRKHTPLGRAINVRATLI
jgi:hypothetical protein